MKFYTSRNAEMNFSSDLDLNYWTQESKNSLEDLPIPENPRDDRLLINLEGQKEERSIQVRKEPITHEQEREANIQMRIHQDSVSSFLNQNKVTKTRRGIKKQSKVQMILRVKAKSHICKNFPAEMFRKIQKYLEKINKKYLLEMQKKRFNVKELIKFIKFSGLTEEDWEQIFDFPSTYEQIEISNKYGTSKHFEEMSIELKNFLIQLGKEAQKILYRSAKRVIIQMLNGAEFVSYLDNRAHTELFMLDQWMESSPKYSAEYKSLLKSLK